MPYNYETLQVSFAAEGVLSVKLNRPKKLNAMNSQFWDDMTSCFQQASQDGNVRCIVLSANGRAFSAGLDLVAFQEPGVVPSGTADPARRALRFFQDTKRLQNAISAVEKCWKPTIVAIHGMCIGGGVDLITACDIRFCSSDATFCVKEAAIGLAADIGTLQRLPKIIGNESLVRELAFTARNMGSEEAASCGLVSYVGKDREDLMRHALNTATVISGHSPVGITSTKVNILYSRDHSVDDGLDFVLAWNAFALQTEDVKKAVVAGMTKKKAKFSKL